MSRDEFEAMVEEEMIQEELIEENVENDKEEEEEAIDEPEQSKVSPKEALEALEKVRSYCQERKFDDLVHHSLRRVENQCIIESGQEKSVQKSITDFFM